MSRDIDFEALGLRISLGCFFTGLFVWMLALTLTAVIILLFR